MDGISLPFYVVLNLVGWHLRCRHTVTVTALLAVESLWKGVIMAARTFVLFLLEIPTSRCRHDKLADLKLTPRVCVCVCAPHTLLCLNGISLILPPVCKNTFASCLFSALYAFSKNWGMCEKIERPISFYYI